MTTSPLPLRRTATSFTAFLTVAACAESPIDPGGDEEEEDIPRFASCDLNVDFMIAGAVRDGIPSLDDPAWDRADASIPDYLDDETRVIGVFANGSAFAVPLNVLWSHEIVNLDTGGPNAPRLSITYCPLTGSSLVLDRASVGGATLGVSGILFMNNLLVYDRRDPEDTLWPQMLAWRGRGHRLPARRSRGSGR